MQMSMTIAKLLSVMIANEDFTISWSAQRECKGINNIGLDFDEGNSCSEKGHDEPRIIMPTNTLVGTNKRKTSPRVSLFCVFSYSRVCPRIRDCYWMTWRRRKCPRKWCELSWDWLILDRVNDAHKYARNIYKLTYVHKIL